MGFIIKAENDWHGASSCSASQFPHFIVSYTGATTIMYRQEISDVDQLKRVQLQCLIRACWTFRWQTSLLTTSLLTRHTRWN